MGYEPTTLGCKHIGIKKFELVKKNSVLSPSFFGIKPGKIRINNPRNLRRLCK